jgi:predicted RNA-binding Zn ribbon-like protein
MRYSGEMTVDVQAMPVAAVVQLVNGWGTVPRQEAGGRPAPPAADLLAVLGHAGSVAAAELQRVADQLFPVFAAAGAAARARRVTDLLADARVRPALTADSGEIRGSWLVPRKRDVLLAAAAISLQVQLAEHGSDRLGTCGANRCADVYVDASPAGHRRFCSVTCQNRARVAVFRRRQSGAKG